MDKKGSIRICTVVYFSRKFSRSRKEQRARKGQLWPVAFQVSLGLTFSFSEGIVYFHIVLGYSVKYLMMCIYLRKSQSEQNMLRFVMNLSSPMTSFQILRLCQENFMSIALYRKENHQPTDLGQLLDIPGLSH